MSKYDKFLPIIKELHSKGLRNNEISKEIGVDSRRVSDLLKKLGLKSNKIQKLNPTDEQMSILVGAAMGDGTIFKSKLNKNYRMALAHSMKQKDYFLMKYEKLKNLIKTDWKLNKEYDKRTKKYYHNIKFQSRVNPLYNELYKEWYEDGKKVIRERNKSLITPLALAVKYFDDGYDIRGGGGIAMSSFDDESVRVLSEVINSFGIETTTWSDKTIYIKKGSFTKFKELIGKYATKDVLYKLGEFTETPNV